MWLAYRVATVRGPRHMCGSANRTKVMLEPATADDPGSHIDNRRIDRLQTATPDSEIDAGGLPVVWLEGISPAQRAA